MYSYLNPHDIRSAPNPIKEKGLGYGEAIIRSDPICFHPYSRFPLLFHPADEALNKDNDLMMAIITPRAIPVNTFGSGKNTNVTYEFYNSLALVHQLAFGQLPIKLCYADVIKPRETITSGLDWIRVAQLPPDADTADIDLSTWVPASFITESYKSWWQEWKGQLFAVSAHVYRNMINSEHEIPNDTVSLLPTLSLFFTLTTSVTDFFILQVDDPTPPMSRSGRPFNL
jgi:hypothetical protein